MQANPTPAHFGVDELEWTLKDLLQRVPGVQHIVALSEDGLPVPQSGTLARNVAEHLAATASALQSLSNGAAKLADAAVNGMASSQEPHAPLIVVELTSGFLYVRQGPSGTLLAVLTGLDNVDAGLLSSELDRIVDQAGAYLATPERKPGGAGA